jgi:FkbM family methyltransferase
MLTKGKNNKKMTLSSWLLVEPFAYAIPSIRLLDKASSFLSRVVYIILRIFLRCILGKTKREKVQFYHKLYFRLSLNISFSFYFFMFLYKIIRVIRLGKPSLVKISVPKYNYKVYCPPTVLDYLFMTIREEDIIEHFQPKQGDIVIDVGAHLGRYALISSNKVGKEGKVIAIEAHPMVFEKLNKNLKLNKVTNTIILNYAVHSGQTKLKLFLPRESIDTIYSPHGTVMLGRDNIPLNRSKDGRIVNVDANTLDNIIHSEGIKAEDVKWIKIDVEGAEYEVLKGTKEILSTSTELAILIEVHQVLYLEENKNLYKDIMEFLKIYNFKIEFEKIHVNGEMHIIVRKQQL